MRTSLLAVILVLAPAAARAQTFVVDASGGPGSSFKDLPEAIASVPSGAVLRVRPGSYSPFTLANKSLSIIGDSRTGVVIDADQRIVVGPTAPGQSILLRSLRIEINPILVQPPIDLRNLLGPLVLSEVDVDGTRSFYNDAQVAATNCANLHLLECVISRANAAGVPLSRVDLSNSTAQISHCTLRGSTFAGENGPGGRGITMRASTVFLVASQVRGGNGGNGSFIGPGPGADAISLHGDSHLHAVGATSSIVGGNGGNFREQCAPGGAGVKLADSVARVEGFTPRGGGSCTSPGPAFDPDPGSTVIHNPTSQPPVGTLAGTSLPGSIMLFDVTGAPLSLAVLMFGVVPMHINPEPLVVGPLLTLPALVLLPVTIPGSGRQQVPLQLPGNIARDVPVYGQWVSLEPGSAQLLATNSVLLMVKS